MRRSSAAMALKGLCGGAVHLPGDPTYDLARAAWNTAADQRPAAVAYPADAAEVAAVVRAARSVGLRVAPQGTGHHAAALGALNDAVLVRTAAMTGVSVDRRARRARVGAGMLWADVVPRLSPLAALHPVAPDVGVAGYSLSGGLSWYGRCLGLQSSSVTAIEVVTADGTQVRTDAGHDPDLFWALRGGGANFGVVTGLEFALHAVGEVHAGLLAWDWTRAESILPRWIAWAANAPETVTTSLRITRMSSVAPPELRGRRLVVIDGAVLGPAPSVLAELRALRPEVDTFAAVAPAALLRLHLEPEGPRALRLDSVLLGELGPAAVDAFLATAGPGPGTTLRTVELRQLGGALARPDPAGGALSHVDGSFLLVAASEENGTQGADDVRLVLAAMAPFATGRRYLGLSADQDDGEAGFDPDAWSRLRKIRSAVDPDQLFIASHPIPPVS